MNIQQCSCTPLVKDPHFQAWLFAQFGGIFSPGHTEAEAIENLKRHARRDGINQRDWTAMWTTKLDGSLVRRYTKSTHKRGACVRYVWTPEAK